MLAAAVAMASSCRSSSVDDRGDAESTDDASEETDDASSNFSGDEIVRTYAPTFSAVYSEILLPNCSSAYCHGGSGDYFQILGQEPAYQALVNVPAQGPLCAPTGLDRVVPGHPETSLMYLKITDPPCGQRMPPPLIFDALPARDVAQVEQWIAMGAHDD